MIFELLVGFAALSCFLSHSPDTDFDTSHCELSFVVKDAKGQKMPCRIHVFANDGKPVSFPEKIYWHDHFVCPGEAIVKLKPGKFRWVIEKGPEFESKNGMVEFGRSGKKEVSVTLKRISDLRSKGWIGGDLHVHRNPEHIKLLMQAEELAFAPVITWWNRPASRIPSPAETVFRFDKFRIFTTMAGEDEREGGALLYFGMDRPLDLTVKSREYPSPMAFVRQAREHNPKVWIDIEKPFWWDVPVWAASGKMDSIGIANNHMCRSQMLASEAWGKPRNVTRLPGPHGNGFWTQEIYYHLLNSGLRIPPSAGSASGVLANPVGYNRVYVHCGQEFTRESWFAALKKGQAFVTNGPLLEVKVDGKLPGSELIIDAATKKIEIDIELISRDFVPRLEVVFNGKVVKSVACEKKLKQTKSISLEIDKPGWILVRAIANVKPTFRFASTAPWYIQTASTKTSISRSSAQFFLDWTNERIKRIQKNVKDPTQRTEIIKHHDRAVDFWKKKVKAATRE